MSTVAELALAPGRVSLLQALAAALSHLRAEKGHLHRSASALLRCEWPRTRGRGPAGHLRRCGTQRLPSSPADSTARESDRARNTRSLRAPESAEVRPVPKSPEHRGAAD